MRVRWSEHEARSAIAAWRKSGVSIDEFAKAHGLVPQRLYWWRKRLESTVDETQPAVKLLPVEVSSTRGRGEPVAVFLRTGHVVKVGRDFDEEAFKRVVALLEGA